MNAHRRAPVLWTLLSAGVLLTHLAQAAPITTNTAHQPLSLTSVQTAGLTDAQAERYQTLMQEGAARWYAHLHPLEVLGIYAQTHEERRQYAHQVAKLRTERVAREIAFQQALDAAHQVMYRDLLPIQPFAAPSFTTARTPSDLQAGDRLVWLTHDVDTSPQTAALMTLLAQHPQVMLQIVAPNPHTQRVIKRMLTTHPKAARLMRQGQIQWDMTLPAPLSITDNVNRLYHVRRDHIRPFQLSQVHS